MTITIKCKCGKCFLVDAIADVYKCKHCGTTEGLEAIFFGEQNGYNTKKENSGRLVIISFFPMALQR